MSVKDSINELAQDLHDFEIISRNELSDLTINETGLSSFRDTAISKLGVDVYDRIEKEAEIIADEILKNKK